MTLFWIDATGKILAATSDDVEEYPGATEAITTPPESGKQKWNGTSWDSVVLTTQEHNDAIYAQIDALELSTLRSLRDSARGNGSVPGQGGVTPRQRLDDIEAQIEALRLQLR